MPYADLKDRREQQRRYRAKNREQINAYNRAYYANYVPRNSSDLRWYLSRVLATARWRRPENAVNVDYLQDLWRAQNGKCALTGLEMTHSRRKTFHYDTNASVDRLNPKLGYEAGNIRLVCKRANVMRMDMTDEELRKWCNLIARRP